MENYQDIEALSSQYGINAEYASDGFYPRFRENVKGLRLSLLCDRNTVRYAAPFAEKLRGISCADSPEDKDRMLSELEREIQQRLQNDNRLDDFYARVELLHKDFSVKLAESFPTLTAQERKLATLLRLGFSTKYIASLMYITPKSVEIERYRLRRKLGLKRSDNLITFIKSI